jgi:hypothetical protein
MVIVGMVRISTVVARIVPRRYDYRGFGYRGGDYCRGSLRIIVGAIRESPLQGLSVMTITP